jgi:hypothetical protein
LIVVKPIFYSHGEEHAFSHEKRRLHSQYLANGADAIQLPRAFGCRAIESPLRDMPGGLNINGRKFSSLYDDGEAETVLILESRVQVCLFNVTAWGGQLTAYRIRSTAITLPLWAYVTHRRFCSPRSSHVIR